MVPLDEHGLNVLSSVLGWAYFFAWSFSFYPQVVLNYRRKRVDGLSFDFLLYNITGFLCYSVYNVSIRYIPVFRDQYLDKHGPPIPVKVNDVVFALHAVVLTSIQIAQCFIYERGSQSISRISIGISGVLWISMEVVALVCALGSAQWLFFMFYLSYVKLGVTIIKYMPQAWLNYRRKATIGWSIGNVLLDFSGGTLSFAQQLVDALNSGKWSVFTGDPAKLGLALFSILFDVLFMLQHYVCYRHAPDAHEARGSSSSSSQVGSDYQPQFITGSAKDYTVLWDDDDHDDRRDTGYGAIQYE